MPPDDGLSFWLPNLLPLYLLPIFFFDAIQIKRSFLWGYVSSFSFAYEASIILTLHLSVSERGLDPVPWLQQRTGRFFFFDAPLVPKGPCPLFGFSVRPEVFPKSLITPLFFSFPNIATPQPLSLLAKLDLLGDPSSSTSRLFINVRVLRSVLQCDEKAPFFPPLASSRSFSSFFSFILLALAFLPRRLAKAHL